MITPREFSTRLFLAAVAAVSVLASAPRLASADPPYDEILVSKGSDVEFTYHINRLSAVNGTTKEFKQSEISIRGGDSVSIAMGGCVLRPPAPGFGGGGGTPYDRAREFSALAEVTGAWEGPLPIESIAGQWFPVGGTTTPSASSVSLRISPDALFSSVLPSGAPCPVANVDFIRGITVNPFVTVSVRRPRVPVVLIAPARPLDLISNTRDLNGLMLNPYWGSHVRDSSPTDVAKYCRGPGDLSTDICSSQLRSRDEASAAWKTGASPVCAGAHINWFPITVEGTIRWHEWDHGWFHDEDYNIELTPLNPNLLTKGNDWIKGEFDSTETVENYSHWWWQAFQSSDDEHKSALIDGKRAIAIGLMGFDLVHEIDPELHPVHALAIEVKTPTFDNRWAVFVRNTGNEGNCSSSQHELGRSDITLEFTRPDGFDGTLVVDATELKGPSGAKVTYENKYASVRVTFHLPFVGAAIHGLLALRWANIPAPAMRLDTARRHVVTPPPMPSVGRAHVNRGDESEIGAYMSKMSPAQVAKFDATMKSHPRPTPPTLTSLRATPAPTPQGNGTAAPGAGYRAVPDPLAETRRRRLQEALCAAFDGRVPVPTGARGIVCTTVAPGVHQVPPPVAPPAPVPTNHVISPPINRPPAPINHPVPTTHPPQR